jgi:uncharacterized protein (TIGR03000 family)
MLKHWVLTLGVTAIVTAVSLLTPETASAQWRRGWRGARRGYYGRFYGPRFYRGYYRWPYFGGYRYGYRYPVVYGGYYYPGFYGPTYYYGGYVPVESPGVVLYGAPKVRYRTPPVTSPTEEETFEAPRPREAEDEAQAEDEAPPPVRRGAVRQRGAARVIVRVPVANAVVTMNDQPTRERGVSRTFEITGLSAGKAFPAKFTARWKTADGREVRRSRAVQLRAGRTVTIDFTRGPIRKERLGPPKADPNGP